MKLPAGTRDHAARRSGDRQVDRRPTEPTVYDVPAGLRRPLSARRAGRVDASTSRSASRVPAGRRSLETDPTATALSSLPDEARAGWCPAARGARSPSPARSRSRCSSACTCTGSARGGSSRRRSSARRLTLGGRRSPATGFPARRWSRIFSLTSDQTILALVRLRLHRLGPAGLAAAVPARLPLELPQDRHHRPAGRRRDRRQPDAASARRSTTSFAGRRADFHGQHLPVRLHLHHVRGDLRVPRARVLGHDAEDDRQGDATSGRSATGRC